jgi:hypothetical protein
MNGAKTKSTLLASNFLLRLTERDDGVDRALQNPSRRLDSDCRCYFS